MLRIGGPIPISIYPFFWLLAAGIGWLNTFSLQGTIVWVFIILISVLIHEYGHALTAVFFGQRAQIELVAFGGVTQRRGGKKKLWQEFLIVLNGPLAGFLFCGLAWWWSQLLMHNGANAHSLTAYAAKVTFYVNLFWTVVNLVPVQPLDGGKLLNIILEAIFGLKGTKIALFLSMVVSALISLLFFSLQAFLAGALFFLLTFESYRSWKHSLTLTEHDQDFILQHLLREASHDKQIGNKKEALEKLQRIRGLSSSGVIYQKATEDAAHLLAEQGEDQAAYDILMPLSSQLTPESVRFLHQLAYRQGEWKNAAALGDRAYQISPSYETALINALSHSLLGQVKPAVGWLQCAIRNGVPNLQEVLKKREFDPIRSDPLFKQFDDRFA